MCVCVCVCVPMPLSACCSSKVKAVRGTSSDTGRMATVDRLETGFPASHLLVGVWRARLRAARKKRVFLIVYFSQKKQKKTEHHTVKYCLLQIKHMLLYTRVLH